MAQINSEAGKSQAAGNVAVVPGASEVGPTTSTKALATATLVTYGQVEPGWHERSSKPTRM